MAEIWRTGRSDSIGDGAKDSKDEVGKSIGALLLVGALTIRPVVSTAPVPCRSKAWWGNGVAVYASMRISVMRISAAGLSSTTTNSTWNTDTRQRNLRTRTNDWKPDQQARYLTNGLTEQGGQHFGAATDMSAVTAFPPESELVSRQSRTGSSDEIMFRDLLVSFQVWRLIP